MSDTTIAHATADAVLQDACDKALRYHLEGHLDLAHTVYTAVLAASPEHPAANFALAMLEVQQGQAQRALPRLRALVRARPAEAHHWSGLADVLTLTGATEEARQALEQGRLRGLHGADVDALAERLGSRLPYAHLRTQLLAALDTGGADRAEALARELTTRFPEDGLGWKVRGSLCWVRARDPQAEALLRRAVLLLPDDAEVWANLGHVQSSAARWTDAEPSYRRALALAPEMALIHFHLGKTLLALGRLDEAEHSLLRALTHQPEQVDTLSQLAEVCLAGGRVDAALAWYGQLLALPGLSTAERDNIGSARLFALAHQPGVSAEQLFAEHQRYGASLLQAAPAPAQAWCNGRDPQRVIAVGLVSGDLYNHAVSLFLAPILARLAAAGSCQVHVYQTQATQDEVSASLRTFCHRWSAVHALDDEALAQRIRADGIDILIDLAGHTGGHRLRVFARRAAPVQASWLGYAGTTGVAAMDYYIGDAAYLPPGFECQFSEQLVRLPGTVPLPEVRDLPPVSPLPALAAGHVTFGSFNRGGKINATTLGLWSGLLRAVPDSRILIGHIGGSSLEPIIRQALGDAGVVPARIDFVGKLGFSDYLRCHARVDLCLDTFPYTGGTTTSSALLMGVPTLTIGGPTPISRQGALRMAAAGLHDFVAADATQFVTCGAHWASRTEELAALRSGMRARLDAAPGLQADVIAAAFGQALRTMWQRWCGGLPPAAFTI